MSADRIELFDYIDQLRCSVPDVHPAGRMMIHHWLGEMREAAARDDAATVVKLAQMIAAKIEHDEHDC